VLLNLTVEDFLDVSKTLGRIFEIGVSHTNGDLATDWSPSSQFLAPVLAGKHVWLNAQNSTELSERLRQFYSAYLSSPTDTSACVLIRQSASVDLHLLKNFVEVLTLPKGSLVRRLSGDGEWSIAKSPEKLRVLSSQISSFAAPLPEGADGTGGPGSAASAAPISQSSRRLPLWGSLCRPPPDLLPEAQGGRQSGG
jgi:hypothetical protein